MIGGNNATVVFIWSRQIIYLNVSMIYVLIIGLHLRIFMVETIDAMTTSELIKVLIKHYYTFGRTSCFICDKLRYTRGRLYCDGSVRSFSYWYELNHRNPMCGDYEPRFD